MRVLVGSLRRLFASGKVAEGRLAQMVENGSITQEEKAYITGEKEA